MEGNKDGKESKRTSEREFSAGKLNKNIKRRWTNGIQSANNTHSLRRSIWGLPREKGKEKEEIIIWCKRARKGWKSVKGRRRK